MYINMYGCDKYQSTYVGDAAAGAAMGADPMYWCEHPKAYPLFAALFWVVFVLISAFILLSLFIGAVTVSMGEIMDQIQVERAREMREAAEESVDALRGKRRGLTEERQHQLRGVLAKVRLGRLAGGDD